MALLQVCTHVALKKRGDGAINMACHIWTFVVFLRVTYECGQHFSYSPEDTNVGLSKDKGPKYGRQSIRN